MTWQVAWQRGGIYLPQIDWWLDAPRGTPRSFVSHAHSDHIARHRETLSTAATVRLMRERLGGKRVERVLDFGQVETVAPDCTATLYPAGHILGSAMALFSHAEQGRLLYTGDFKLKPGGAAECCEAPAADVLIMETTFGRPRYTLPPAENVRADLVAFCRDTLAADAVPVLLGYSLGKAQEIQAALVGADFRLMVHPQISRMNAVYSEFGYNLPPSADWTPARAGGHVVVAPPNVAGGREMQTIPRARTAIVSGWAVDSGAIYRYGCDAAFPLSDHADYPDLLALVERVSPRQVWTTHGFAADFARDLRQRGVEAWALGRDNQLEFDLGPPTPQMRNRDRQGT